MRKLLPFLALLLYASASHAQWFFQNPYPTGTKIWQIRYISQEKALAVGEYGAIVRSTDGGATWTQPGSGTSEHLYDFCFLNEENGYAVGANGTMLRTTDGGLSWSSKDVLPGISMKPVFSAVYFLDGNTGFIGGSYGWMMRTTDGGATWTHLDVAGSGYIKEFKFLTPTHGFSCDDFMLAESQDAGQTWVWRDVVPGYELYDMDFPTADTGFILSGGGVYRSTDAGATWAWIAERPTMCRVMSFTDGYHGCTSTSSSSYVTSDGGLTWQKYTASDPAIIVTQDFYDRNTGLRGGDNGMLWKTTDAGATWTHLDHNCSRGLNNYGSIQDLFMVDDHTGYAMDSQFGFYRLNGGEWDLVMDPPFYFAGLCLWFIDAQNGLMSGYGGIVKTTDGGVSWSYLLTDSESTPYEHLVFTSPDTGYVVRSGNALMKTVTGGSSWFELATGTTQGINDVCFTDARTGFLASNHGMVQKTTDGGITWSTPVSTGVDRSITSIGFGDASTGIAVTVPETAFDSSRILRTTDGGNTWSQTTYPAAEATFHNVTFATPQTAYIVGEAVRQLTVPYGIILKTTDGGATWSLQQAATENPLFVASFVSANEGWAGGTESTILHTTNGGSVGIESLQPPTPGSAILRCTPNPVRGQAVISYTLASQGPVRVVLYNQLGQSVRVLADEVQTAGTHSIRLTSSDLPSGFYIAQLTAGNTFGSIKVIVTE